MRQRLDVSENNLEDIPRSLFTISTLESLNISKNQISTLPPKIALPRLRIFEARENNLKELPFQLVCCHELEVLHLDGNPLEQSVFTLASKLPKLFDFSHS